MLGMWMRGQSVRFGGRHHWARRQTSEVIDRCNLAESSKKGYGSKRAILPMMMMMMIHPFPHMYSWCSA
jgi:hypothetical protein